MERIVLSAGNKGGGPAKVAETPAAAAGGGEAMPASDKKPATAAPAKAEPAKAPAKPAAAAPAKAKATTPVKAR
jgi:2-oxoglutarate dehydrogenase E1 component